MKDAVFDGGLGVITFTEPPQNIVFSLDGAEVTLERDEYGLLDVHADVPVSDAALSFFLAVVSANNYVIHKYKEALKSENVGLLLDRKYKLEEAGLL